eukprot:COSAG06_NODE_36016_length_452_cov_6.507082_1_plen_45_part_01
MLESTTDSNMQTRQVLTQRRVRRRQRDLASAKSGQRSTTHTVWLQ